VYEGVVKNNYLYNGKELLDEDADLGWLDYGFRNYDPQIGRFPQLDPLSWEYPYYTPYQFAGNDPIANVDLDGLEPLNVIGHVGDAIVTSKSLLQEVVITTAKIAKKISLSAGQITVKALQINNALNVIVTKPVTCHGAYQYGFSPYVGSMNSKSRWGIVLTSEEGGGNNAPKGETEDDPIKADLLMALLKSWMGNDPSFTKSIFEMIEKLPERILQVSESIKTFNDLIEKKIEDIYIARYKNNNLRKEFSKNEVK
jgi:RHS repeat-associated protein